LHSGQLDFVINVLYPTAPPPAGLVFIPLYEEECVPLCAPNHRLAARTHVPLVELSKERWALSGAVLATLQRLREVFRDSGLEPPRIAFESRSLSLRLQVTANSDLLLYTSRAHATRLVTAPLHVLPVKELYWLRSVGVLHREEPYMSPAVRRFIDILKQITSSGQTEAPAARLREQTPS
jgi:DNA-binding transcriptional LysR family regulator